MKDFLKRDEEKKKKEKKQDKKRNGQTISSYSFYVKVYD